MENVAIGNVQISYTILQSALKFYNWYLTGAITYDSGLEKLV